MTKISERKTRLSFEESYKVRGIMYAYKWLEETTAPAP